MSIESGLNAFEALSMSLEVKRKSKEVVARLETNSQQSRRLATIKKYVTQTAFAARVALSIYTGVDLDPADTHKHYEIAARVTTPEVREDMTTLIRSSENSSGASPPQEPDTSSARQETEKNYQDKVGE
jgi:hypothetical protein